MRLQLATLLVVLVRQAGAAVGAYLAEVVAMVAAALADGYHEVNLVACSVVQGLIGRPGCCGGAEMGAAVLLGS